jgi:hypothetical protein
MLTENRRQLHYATYFDRHYLSRGLTLYRSLARHSPPFVLWVLCLDEETHRTLSNLGLEQVELVRLAELEQADPALLAAKPGRQVVEYYWTCGPAFLVYLLEQHPPIDMLTYLDADLFFFGDPTPIYDELGDGSILLIEHRYSPSMQALYAHRGLYNVGLLVFRGTAVGLACLRRWREQCIDWCFHREEPNRFADQKYLEEWPGRYEGVAVLCHRGAGLAPWNLANYCLSHDRRRVLVDGEPLFGLPLQPTQSDHPLALRSWPLAVSPENDPNGEETSLRSVRARAEDRGRANSRRGWESAPGGPSSLRSQQSRIPGAYGAARQLPRGNRLIHLVGWRPINSRSALPLVTSLLAGRSSLVPALGSGRIVPTLRGRM